jgi:hypothetical protein
MILKGRVFDEEKIIELKNCLLMKFKTKRKLKLSPPIPAAKIPTG